MSETRGELSESDLGIALLVALGVEVYLLWCTVIAFEGGTLPVLGWELEGGLGEGLFWLLIVDPIVGSVVYFVAALVIAALVSGRNAASGGR